MVVGLIIWGVLAAAFFIVAIHNAVEEHLNKEEQEHGKETDEGAEESRKSIRRVQGGQAKIK